MVEGLMRTGSKVGGRRGLATADMIAGMSEDAAIDLIFMPGFSTAPTSPTCRGGAWAWMRCGRRSNGWEARPASRPAKAPAARAVRPPLQRDDDAGDDG